MGKPQKFRKPEERMLTVYCILSTVFLQFLIVLTSFSFVINHWGSHQYLGIEMVSRLNMLSCPTTGMQVSDTALFHFVPTDTIMAIRMNTSSKNIQVKRSVWSPCPPVQFQLNQVALEAVVSRPSFHFLVDFWTVFNYMQVHCCFG